MTFDKETTERPFSLKRIPLWHIPLPIERKRIGAHPSRRIGSGGEILKVRPLEPDEGMQFYSPQHSAQFGVPWGVFFEREQETRVIIVVDFSPSIDFGFPSKRWVAMRVAATLGTLAMLQPNEGFVTFFGEGEKSHPPSFASSMSQIPAALKSFSASAPRQIGSTFASALKHRALAGRESLICVISDFLIPFQNEEEWEILSTVYRSALQLRNEMIFIRVLDPLECDMPGGGSVTVSSGGGRGIWTSFGTNKNLRYRQNIIRKRLLDIVGDAETEEEKRVHFLEVVWRNSAESPNSVKRKLKQFLRNRERYVRARLKSASV